MPGFAPSGSKPPWERHSTGPPLGFDLEDAVCWDRAQWSFGGLGHARRACGCAETVSVASLRKRFRSRAGTPTILRVDHTLFSCGAGFNRIRFPVASGNDSPHRCPCRRNWDCDDASLSKRFPAPALKRRQTAGSTRNMFPVGASFTPRRAQAATAVVDLKSVCVLVAHSCFQSPVGAFHRPPNYA